MNIAILGGSFDPPHKGHIIIANRLLKLNNFDQIWLMPCYRHPFNKNLSSPNQRLEMTKYLENHKIKVSDFEVSKKTTSYTIDTLKFLAKNCPKNRFSWIIGNDQMDNFKKWKDWKEIINNFKLIIVPRTATKKTGEELKNIVLIDRKKFPPIYISSTRIRKRAKENKSIASMVPKKVEEYIIKNKLYQ